MLGKLMKYELKGTARLFFPLYGALLIFAFINRLLLGISRTNGIQEIKGVPGAIGMTLFMMTIAAIFAMTCVVMVQRFYKNLLGDEGYLMFTLPVKPWQHILTKMLVSIIWLIISSIVTIISVLVMVANMELLWTLYHGLKELIMIFNQKLGIDGYAFGVEMMLLALISMAGSVLMVYLSLAIGHLVSRHKLLASIGAFVGIQTVGNAAGMLLTNGLSKVFDFETVTLESSIGTLHGMTWILIIFSLVFCVIYFFFTDYILKHNLNLE